MELARSAESYNHEGPHHGLMDAQGGHHGSGGEQSPHDPLNFNSESSESSGGRTHDGKRVKDKRACGEGQAERRGNKGRGVSGGGCRGVGQERRVREDMLAAVVFLFGRVLEERGFNAAMQTEDQRELMLTAADITLHELSQTNDYKQLLSASGEAYGRRSDGTLTHIHSVVSQLNAQQRELELSFEVSLETLRASLRAAVARGAEMDRRLAEQKRVNEEREREDTRRERKLCDAIHLLNLTLHASTNDNESCSEVPRNAHKAGRVTGSKSQYEPISAQGRVLDVGGGGVVKPRSAGNLHRPDSDPRGGSNPRSERHRGGKSAPHEGSRGRSSSTRKITPYSNRGCNKARPSSESRDPENDGLCSKLSDCVPALEQIGHPCNDPPEGSIDQFYPDSGGGGSVQLWPSSVQDTNHASLRCLASDLERPMKCEDLMIDPALSQSEARHAEEVELPLDVNSSEFCAKTTSFINSSQNIHSYGAPPALDSIQVTLISCTDATCVPTERVPLGEDIKFDETFKDLERFLIEDFTLDQSSRPVTPDDDHGGQLIPAEAGGEGFFDGRENQRQSNVSSAQRDEGFLSEEMKRFVGKARLESGPKERSRRLFIPRSSSSGQLQQQQQQQQQKMQPQQQQQQKQQQQKEKQLQQEGNQDTLEYFESLHSRVLPSKCVKWSPRNAGKTMGASTDEGATERHAGEGGAIKSSSGVSIESLSSQDLAELNEEGCETPTHPTVERWSPELFEDYPFLVAQTNKGCAVWGRDGCVATDVDRRKAANGEAIDADSERYAQSDDVMAKTEKDAAETRESDISAFSSFSTRAIYGGLNEKSREGQIDDEIEGRRDSDACREAGSSNSNLTVYGYRSKSSLNESLSSIVTDSVFLSSLSKSLPNSNLANTNRSRGQRRSDYETTSARLCVNVKNFGKLQHERLDPDGPELEEIDHKKMKDAKQNLSDSDGIHLRQSGDGCYGEEKGLGEKRKVLDATKKGLDAENACEMNESKRSKTTEATKDLKRMPSSKSSSLIRPGTKTSSKSRLPQTCKQSGSQKSGATDSAAPRKGMQGSAQSDSHASRGTASQSRGRRSVRRIMGTCLAGPKQTSRTIITGAWLTLDSSSSDVTLAQEMVANGENMDVNKIKASRTGRDKGDVTPCDITPVPCAMQKEISSDRSPTVARKDTRKDAMKVVGTKTKKQTGKEAEKKLAMARSSSTGKITPKNTVLKLASKRLSGVSNNTDRLEPGVSGSSVGGAKSPGRKLSSPESCVSLPALPNSARLRSISSSSNQDQAARSCGSLLLGTTPSPDATAPYPRDDAPEGLSSAISTPQEQHRLSDLLETLSEKSGEGISTGGLKENMKARDPAVSRPSRDKRKGKRERKGESRQSVPIHSASSAESRNSLLACKETSRGRLIGSALALRLTNSKRALGRSSAHKQSPHPSKIECDQSNNLLLDTAAQHPTDSVWREVVLDSPLSLSDRGSAKRPGTSKPSDKMFVKEIPSKVSRSTESSIDPNTVSSIVLVNASYMGSSNEASKVSSTTTCKVSSTESSTMTGKMSGKMSENTSSKLSRKLSGTVSTSKIFNRKPTTYDLKDLSEIEKSTEAERSDLIDASNKKLFSERSVRNHLKKTQKVTSSLYVSDFNMSSSVESLTDPHNLDLLESIPSMRVRWDSDISGSARMDKQGSRCNSSKAELYSVRLDVGPEGFASPKRDPHSLALEADMELDVDDDSVAPHMEFSSKLEENDLSARQDLKKLGIQNEPASVECRGSRKKLVLPTRKHATWAKSVQQEKQLSPKRVRPMSAVAQNPKRPTHIATNQKPAMPVDSPRRMSSSCSGRRSNVSTRTSHSPVSKSCRSPLNHPSRGLVPPVASCSPLPRSSPALSSPARNAKLCKCASPHLNVSYKGDDPPQTIFTRRAPSSHIMASPSPRTSSRQATHPKATCLTSAGAHSIISPIPHSPTTRRNAGQGSPSPPRFEAKEERRSKASPSADIRGKAVGPKKMGGSMSRVRCQGRPPPRNAAASPIRAACSDEREYCGQPPCRKNPLPRSFAIRALNPLFLASAQHAATPAPAKGKRGGSQEPTGPPSSRGKGGDELKLNLGEDEERICTPGGDDQEKQDSTPGGRKGEERGFYPGKREEGLDSQRGRGQDFIFRGKGLSPSPSVVDHCMGESF